MINRNVGGIRRDGNVVKSSYFKHADDKHRGGLINES